MICDSELMRDLLFLSDDNETLFYFTGKDPKDEMFYNAVKVKDLDSGNLEAYVGSVLKMPSETVTIAENALPKIREFVEKDLKQLKPRLIKDVLHITEVSKA